MKFAPHLLTALALCCLIQPAQAKRAPNLEFKDLSGKTQRIADLRGAITVVNFWATWCGPCREELPMLSRLEKEYRPQGVRFIAISADETRGRKNVDKFLSVNPIEMDVWLGASLSTLDRAELGNELPATMILDEQGEVVARILGQAREEDLRRALDWMFAGKTGPAPEAITKHY